VETITQKTGDAYGCTATWPSRVCGYGLRCGLGCTPAHVRDAQRRSSVVLFTYDTIYVLSL